MNRSSLLPTYQFKIFDDAEPKQEDASVSMEGLGASATNTPLVNVATPEYRDQLDEFYAKARGDRISMESVGMCTSITGKPCPVPPISVIGIGEKRLMLCFNSPIIPASVVANALINLDIISDHTLIIKVNTPLNDDTWLSLCSALARCKARTVFSIDFLYNVAALMVLAVVSEVEYGPYSYFIMDAPADLAATGSAGDVEFAVENSKRIHDRVIELATKANLCTADQLKAIYEERAVYGLFGQALADRLKNRVRVTL